MSKTTDKGNRSEIARAIHEMLGDAHDAGVISRATLAYQESWTDRRRHYVDELSSRAADAERRLRNPYDAVESGTLTGLDRMFKERVAELSAIRDPTQRLIVRRRAATTRNPNE